MVKAIETTRFMMVKALMTRPKISSPPPTPFITLVRACETPLIILLRPSKITPLAE